MLEAIGEKAEEYSMRLPTQQTALERRRSSGFDLNTGENVK